MCLEQGGKAVDAVIVTRKCAEQKKKEPKALVDIFPEVAETGYKYAVLVMYEVHHETNHSRRD